MAETLEISRSSLYYRRQPRASRPDRSHDEQIITACGEKPAYGYRRVVWWLGRHHGLVVNGKRALRVMRERGLLVRQRRFQVSRRKDWGKSTSAAFDQSFGFLESNACQSRDVYRGEILRASIR
ncbi:MAG: IS3 family transposase [Terriglobales bacterium]